MSKLFITADIHGSYSAWQTLESLLGKNDMLAVAGDLFDTRYGNYQHADFQPESIKEQINQSNQTIYYVYGNCDTPSFFPGYDDLMTFKFNNKTIAMHHGHFSITPSPDIDIIIQGHTHLCSLEEKGSHIYLNPGSIACPRNGLYTYGVIDKNGVELIELKKNRSICSIKF